MKRDETASVDAAGQEPADPDKEDLARGLPQELVLALVATVALDHGHGEAIASRVFVRILGDVGVNESAARAVLSRMVRRGVLLRVRQGRTVAFHLSDAGRAQLTRGRDRVLSPRPFDHAFGEWTLLSFSVPESRRDLRHQLRARLTWAGFGALRDGVWIAPGAPEIEDVLAGFPEADELTATVDLFTATPRRPTELPALIARVWDLNVLRQEHQTFLDRWETTESGRDGELARLISLLADWFRLLRADPGLPPAHLGPDWPATRSSMTFRRLYEVWERPAYEEFLALVRHA
ncbi:PaaX family transcriptional regulator [Streptomyces spongiae]|uniref:PaaX family transcriptional regulator n=1 Tax=Streptomyces spongiae TaxID=565072 RepID=UPI001883C7D8|nr:PaaX family transcriptional regulator C-terminal domain-containing protein [Streptomyces spongiae]